MDHQTQMMSLLRLLQLKKRIDIYLAGNYNDYMIDKFLYFVLMVLMLSMGVTMLDFAIGYDVIAQQASIAQNIAHKTGYMVCGGFIVKATREIFS
jgi:hypothetical protein